MSQSRAEHCCENVTKERILGKKQTFESLISHDDDNDMMILYDDDNDLSLFPSYFCGFVKQNCWKHYKRARNTIYSLHMYYHLCLFYHYVRFDLCYSYGLGQPSGQMVSQKTIKG